MSSNNKKRIILDVYAGLDDYYAILFLLYAEKAENLEIMAITCTMGNTGVDNVCKSIVGLLEIVERTDIPVYRGVREPIIKTKPFVPYTHCVVDAFLDLDFETEPDMSIVQTKPASVAMEDIVKEYPNEITLMCLGPLTNVALAIKMFDDFIENVKDVYIMGGNCNARENITPTAKFNFYHDPEAAQIVLEEAKGHITIFMYEAALHTTIDMIWRLEFLGMYDHPLTKLLTKAERKYFARRVIRKNLWIPFDYYLATAFVYPEKVISRKTDYYATVELEGSLTRGQMVLDHLQRRMPNVTVIEEISDKYLKEILMDSLF